MREMKDSGIEWIGNIPTSWITNKGKYMFRQRSSKGNHIELQLLSPTQKFGVIPQSMFEELTTNTAVKINEKTDLMTFKTIHKGDYCISLRSFQGGFEYSLYEGVVSPAYTVFFQNGNLCNGYYKYLFKDQSFIKEMNSYTLSLRDGKNISFDDFGNTYLPIPPLAEQETIADYLDRKCAEIGSLISDIQSQIEALEEYKRSVITEAVTKGLDPDVEMRDSGIAWVGDIPVHWITHPLYFYFGERKNKNALGLETNLLSLSYGKIIRKDINSNGGLLPESFNTYNIIEKDDIIIRPTDLQNDKRSLRTGIAREHGIITSAYIAMKAIKSVNPEYFHYLLHAYDVMKVFYNMGNGVRQGLNFSEFSRLMVFEPTIEEQNAIVAYLKEKCDEIDLAIAEKKQQIETIEEYKKSLIFEYVTGKKEVVNE